MKAFAITLTLLASMNSFASTYNCTITKEQLGQDFVEDLEFKVIFKSAKSATITMFDEAISDRCEVKGATVTCRDAEGMPYIATVHSDNQVSLEVGYMLPETLATCTKN